MVGTVGYGMKIFQPVKFSYQFVTDGRTDRQTHRLAVAVKTIIL